MGTALRSDPTGAGLSVAGLEVDDPGDCASVCGERTYRHLKPRAIGECVLPGLCKLKRRKKPARPAREGVANPFRPGERVCQPFCVNKFSMI